MENRWRPMQPSDYPYSMHVKKGVQRRRCLHQGHLQRYKWLVVSKSAGKLGAWCAICVLFGANAEYMGKKLGSWSVDRWLTFQI